mmetsp:Transcript_8686/g.22425  ORF Transcript_8686/g.22425 Transcript_8686/m.22425 type:complete len:91 (+) Transcript_8686:221-493(+)|eukprot:CAMPEP_0198237942 /NCGR_PEP_ID=MMETSP1446-20131203/3681_1 /TAXON_ID=1461542 ORGANISM="Unidentified sp, Strain CCMP2111" /NCGR_SAMPLE_ID=MMETSP1446 /ASSEMBLY_ACC=CAM_ASM_001112 /LENGTH=90 /DNA_ID=CAMNT_0043920221 /DNA_START=284 /DNA_END=556 /DNA_ORIENTATION=+
MEVSATWKLVNEGGQDEHHTFSAKPGSLAGLFSSLKEENNRVLTAYLKKKSVAVEEIDMLEEVLSDSEDENESQAAKKNPKKPKTSDESN